MNDANVVEIHSERVSERAGPRTGDGLDVTLLWCPANGQNDESTVVRVCDTRDGAYFEIAAEPFLALDVYYHPFAYRDCSTADYEDSRLAA